MATDLKAWIFDTHTRLTKREGGSIRHYMDTIVHFSFLFLWARPHLVPENRPGSRPKKKGQLCHNKGWKLEHRTRGRAKSESFECEAWFDLSCTQMEYWRCEMALLTRTVCCRGWVAQSPADQHSSGSSSHAAESLSTLFGPEAQPGNNVNGHIKNEMKTTRLLVRWRCNSKFYRFTSIFMLEWFFFSIVMNHD